MTPLRSSPSGPLTGSTTVPGDKSISHRALMLGTLAVGRTTVSGLLEGHDVLATAAAMTALGATIERAETPQGPVWTIDGVGVGGLIEADRVLDLGNAGTAARLIMGMVATHPITTFLTGDASLGRRPMARAAEPLSRMGAAFVARAGTRLPMAVIGARQPIPIEYELPVPSAQVKSAILLAGLNTPGITTVIEPAPTRDHSELMLRHFGATVEVTGHGKHGRRITVEGQPELVPATLTVPGDPSSAAFPLVAALLRPGSRLVIEGVGMNPLRTGLLATLLEMGAGITVTNERRTGGEPVADLLVTAAESGAILAGVEVPAGRAPSMIDEYPILAVAASFARGRTVMRGLKELRAKESDRLTAIGQGLAACGVAISIDGDDLTVEGTGSPPDGGVRLAANLDHRIAMAFLVLGMAARKPVEIDDGDTIETSFPGFAALMNRLGAAITPAIPAPAFPTPAFPTPGSATPTQAHP